MKFNLKAGGINQVIDPAKLGIVSEGKTMVVGMSSFCKVYIAIANFMPGIDVTHPSPGSKEDAPSAAAIVASCDKFLGQWPCDYSIQESRKEMVTALQTLFLGRLKMWAKKNPSSRLPENIIVYRDGVSEGQFQSVLDEELPLMRNACRQMYPPEATKQGFPKFSIIICGKRHHTRFYPTSTDDCDKSSNCKPGTVIDRGVTETRNWDFFLQPHACLQGTARPCHYYVILDEVFRKQPLKAGNKNPADTLEDLTHNMCHLFGRATKAVSLCPPAYYADLLCTRLRCYLSGYFDPNDASATQSQASSASARSSLDVPMSSDTRETMFYV